VKLNGAFTIILLEELGDRNRDRWFSLLSSKI